MTPVQIGDATLYHGDCRDVLRTLPDNSIDSIVTDPPYALVSIQKRFGKPGSAPAKHGTDGAYARASAGFMGKQWDTGETAFAVDFWQECLRVLKPGGHVLAFGGSRTYHRLACAVEDAGFEIRDQIMWLYGSGFPKSHDVSKGIDKAAGAAREVVGQHIRSGKEAGTYGAMVGNSNITAPATDAARQWQGWGTALKPSFEPLVLASKPLPDDAEQFIIDRSLLELETRLWLLSLASDAGGLSMSNPQELSVALSIAQWDAGNVINTLADLSDRMDTSLLKSAAGMSLNIASSWRRMWADACKLGSTSTTGTKLSTITDLKTLKYCLSEITPVTITLAASHQHGWPARACSAAQFLNAELKRLSATLESSVLASAIKRGATRSLDVDDKISSEPIVMARKPLIGTVAANVLEYGTGAINVDGCRVDAAGDPQLAEEYAIVQNAGARNNSIYGPDSRDRAGAQPHVQGRWPANVIHDGLNEDWARYFYCAKASRKDRGEGNTHPTVKPTDLMAYLCRLVTPPGGVILDPFMGSGSTGKAALREGFRFIGCEREDEYMPIAQARITAEISAYEGK